MLDRLVSIGAGGVLVVGLLVATGGQVLAAGSCALSAPATVRVGDQVVIRGTGFPAATAVAVTLTVAGGPPDAFSVQSDPTGGLAITLTPEPADVGATTVTARAPSACSATTTFTVIGEAGAAPTPAATPAASLAAPSTAPSTAPRTDAVAAAARRPGTGDSSAWLLAFICLAIGLGSLAFGRQRQAR
jgi:hypothetical protein